jgi:DNA-binding SARP family transcriptional activator
VGLVPDDLSAISELVNVEPAEGDACGYHGCGELDGDCTIYEVDEPDDSHHVVASPMSVPCARGWDIMVRLFGSIEAVDRVGNKAAFERSKTTELVAWLATHRDRSTRANARTALWEQDVRDATFANVVSEARRALARLLPPPEGEEWVGRTLTEALPLHSRVTTDAELLAGALAESRGQPPERAIALLRGPVEAIAGLPFEGTSYLWPDGEGLTSNLILTATSAAAELAARCLAVGDTEGVFEATARGLRVLPGHEELIGLRMRAHARAGDHAAVRQEWNSYERAVNADPWSDGEPSPKLVDLRKELLHPSV